MLFCWVVKVGKRRFNSSLTIFLNYFSLQIKSKSVTVYRPASIDRRAAVVNFKYVYVETPAGIAFSQGLRVFPVLGYSRFYLEASKLAAASRIFSAKNKSFSKNNNQQFCMDKKRNTNSLFFLSRTLGFGYCLVNAT